VEVDMYLGQDGSAIVCDGDVAIGGDEDLVETARTERGADDAGDGLCGENVGFDSLVSVLSLLLALVSYDDEGAAVLVFGDLGWREDSGQSCSEVGVGRMNWKVPLDISSSVGHVSKGSI
jgi:hypothetical protein